MWKDYITIDSGVCYGQPCFSGTRIMVYLVLEMLEAGETIQDILKAYPQLTQEHVKAAIHYAVEIVKTGEFVSFAEVS